MAEVTPNKLTLAYARAKAMERQIEATPAPFDPAPVLVTDQDPTSPTYAQQVLRLPGVWVATTSNVEESGGRAGVASLATVRQAAYSMCVTKDLRRATKEEVEAAQSVQAANLAARKLFDANQRKSFSVELPK